MLVAKEVLRPGTYWYVDESTGQPRSCTFTSGDIDYFHQSGKDMLAAGLSIPVPLEHEKTAHPMTPADRLRNNAGHVQDYFKQKVKGDDGSEVEALFSNVDISDPDVAKKIPRTIRWTSPYISSFTDGNGKEWNGVITHLALTTRPRIVKQQPFPNIAAALSIQGSPSSFTAKSFAGGGAGLALSRAGLLSAKAGAFSPAYPVAFSLYSGVALAEPPPFKKKDQKDNKDGKDARDGKDGKPAPAGDEEPPEKSLVDSDGDINIYEVLCDLLDAVGIPMPTGVGEENFTQALYEATMAKVKGATPGASDMSNPDPNNPGNKPPVQQEAPPLYMSLSLEDINKISDPGQKAVALAVHGLRTRQEELAKENASLKNGAMSQAKARRQVRLDRLKGKLPKERFDKVQKLAEGMGFAMSAEGVVQDMMEAMLEVLEEERDLPALLTTPAEQIAVMPHPREYEGELSPERRAEVVEMLCRQGGLRPPAKAS